MRTNVMNVQGQPHNDVLGTPEANPDHPNKPASNTDPHWPAKDVRRRDQSPQSIVIHGTGGWPSLRRLTISAAYECVERLGLFRTARMVSVKGIGPQYFVDPNGTAFSLIGPESFAGNPRVTWHAEEMNGVSVGIENSDVADSGAIPRAAGNAKYWSALSTDTEDLTGRKAYLLLHPANDPDAVVFWAAIFPHYVGAGRSEREPVSAVNAEFVNGRTCCSPSATTARSRCSAASSPLARHSEETFRSFLI